MPDSGSSTSPVPVDDHHGFQAAQVAVGAPLLGELDRGAHELAGVLLELAFQPLEQREGVGGGAGKAADYVALAQAPHLLGVALDDSLADRHLAVATDRHNAALADGQYGGAVPEFRLWLLHTRYPARRDVRAQSPQFKRKAAPVANPANP